jgi:3-oxoacyl-[acyl-carrier-protein] synthase-3
MMATIELAACWLLGAPDRTAALLTGADNVGTPNFDRWSFGLQRRVVQGGVYPPVREHLDHTMGGSAGS